MIRNNEHYTEITKIFNKLTYSRDRWEIFCDFLELSATCISNSLDFTHFDEREKLYLDIIKKYTPEHQKLFPEMFAQLILALEYEYQTSGFVDVLGCLFHELELHNKYKGQFFTPQHVCTMMGKMLLNKDDKRIAEQGFISVMEPTIGSGAMVLGFAQAMMDEGFNHSQQMLVTGVDIDLKCVHMSYIQLALYGIPAVVVHGNSLTMEEWSHWYTPVYLIHGWQWKRQRKVESQEDTGSYVETQDEAPAPALTEQTPSTVIQPVNAVKPEIVLPSPQEAMKTFEQLSIFDFNTEGE
jgi:type I restriction-modification system DNA methylase subunit